MQEEHFLQPQLTLKAFDCHANEKVEPFGWITAAGCTPPAFGEVTDIFHPRRSRTHGMRRVKLDPSRSEKDGEKSQLLPDFLSNRKLSVLRRSVFWDSFCVSSSPLHSLGNFISIVWPTGRIRIRYIAKYYDGTMMGLVSTSGLSFFHIWQLLKTNRLKKRQRDGLWIYNFTSPYWCLIHGSAKISQKAEANYAVFPTTCLITDWGVY